MKSPLITKKQIDFRNEILSLIINNTKSNDSFQKKSEILENLISNKFMNNGIDSLLGQIRTCSSIPEKFEIDSSEEKLYSKFTDILLSEANKVIGFKSEVITERADRADVEANNENFSFVSDAKVFRLSRTAKNAKDFKVTQMNRWKHGKDFAMIVCPSFQLPKTKSQIYQQATQYNVCIFTYSHLAILVRYASLYGTIKAMQLLHKIFLSIKKMAISKDSKEYWNELKEVMLSFDDSLFELWENEKKINLESIDLLKKESLKFLDYYKNQLQKLNLEEAIQFILKEKKIDSKYNVIESVNDNKILH